MRSMIVGISVGCKRALMFWQSTHTFQMKPQQMSLREYIRAMTPMSHHTQWIMSGNKFILHKHTQQTLCGTQVGFKHAFFCSCVFVCAWTCMKGTPVSFKHAFFCACVFVCAWTCMNMCTPVGFEHAVFCSCVCVCAWTCMNMCTPVSFEHAVFCSCVCVRAWTFHSDAIAYICMCECSFFFVYYQIAYGTWHKVPGWWSARNSLNSFSLLLPKKPHSAFNSSSRPDLLVQKTE
jgi:hypothetical protein